MNDNLVRKRKSFRLPEKFRPKCPICKSVLRKLGKGYTCPKSECRVIKVFFDRDLRVRKVLSEGFDLFPFSGRRIGENRRD